MRLMLASALVLVAAGASGCESGTGGQGAASPATPPSASATAAGLDAVGVARRLAAAGLPLTAVAEQDEDSDPNKKLGRPGGYTSRASADLPDASRTAEKWTVDRGLVVEVFGEAADADARSKFILDALKGSPALGSGWHYRPADQRVLVRVSGQVKPSLARQVEQAVAGL